MRLSAPTFIVFAISVIVAIIAVLAAVGVVPNLPLASVWIMTAAYVVLALACVFKGA